MAVVNAPPPPAGYPTAAPSDGAVVKRKQPERLKYAIPEGGLTEWPADFKVSVHKPLAIKDFAKGSEHIFYENMADAFERRAKSMRQKADTLRKFGSGAQAKAAAGFMKLADRMAELKKQLSAELGEDQVNALLASVMKNGDGKGETH